MLLIRLASCSVPSKVESTLVFRDKTTENDGLNLRSDPRYTPSSPPLAEKRLFANGHFWQISACDEGPLLADSGLSRWAANGRKRLVVPGAEDRGVKTRAIYALAVWLG